MLRDFANSESDKSWKTRISRINSPIKTMLLKKEIRLVAKESFVEIY